MAKKMDRFGWDRDRGTMAHDRIIQDWMDVLQDYPLPEVQDACRKWVSESPRRMPNEGDIKTLIAKARHEQWLARRANLPEPQAQPVARVTPEQAAAILQDVGFAPKRMEAGE